MGKALLTQLQSGKYRIESSLGSGGFGNTYLATQVALGRKVAIKEFFMKEYCNRDEKTSQVIMPTEGSKQIVERYKAKFLKEAQMIASLRNEHIIQIHDIFEENNTAYYVMEYIEGGSLKDKVDSKGVMTEATGIGYIKQVSEALSYLHSRNILHLDVKPSNILIDEVGKVILIDFGISKHYDAEGGQTSTTPACISKGYAPIEQYQQGSIKDFTPSTDIYSLGATLFHLLTGEVPPEASLVYEDGLPSSVNSLSPHVKKAIEIAMSPRRKNRFQTVQDFLAAFLIESDTKTASNKGQKRSFASEDTIVVGPEQSKQYDGISSVHREDKTSGQENKSISRTTLIAVISLAFVVLGVLIGTSVNRNRKLTREASVVLLDPELLLDGGIAKTINFSSKGGLSGAVAITKNFNERWTYSGVPDWCKVTTEVGSITVSASANNKTAERSATIVFGQSGSKDQLAVLTIVQQGKKTEPKTEPKPESIVNTTSSTSSPISINDDSAALQDFIDIEEVIEEEAVPFQLVEEKPLFQGGDANEFSKWVNQRLVYPVEARENAIQGRVTLQFTVAKDGSITNVRVLRGVHPLLDKEAVRVVSMSPKWKPGRQRDKAVSVTYTFPVIFQLK